MKSGTVAHNRCSHCGGIARRGESTCETCQVVMRCMRTGQPCAMNVVKGGTQCRKHITMGRCVI